MQISAVAPAESPVDIAEITDQIREALDGYRGQMGDINVQSVLLENERYIYEEGSSLHHIASDFTFRYQL
jgi:hypothetical protein